MNLNIIAYGIYGLLMSTIIIRVGLLCYRNGQVYVHNILPNQLEFSLYINKVLLAGYYLVNIGYSIYMISTWGTIWSLKEVFSQIAVHSGKIILLLALLHYMNMIGINLIFNKQQSTSKF